MKRPLLGTVLALLSSLLFGLNGSTAKVIMQNDVTPEQLVLFRCLATAILAGLIVLITDRRSFRVAKSEWNTLIAFGVIGGALMQWAYSNAVNTLPIGIALLVGSGLTILHTERRRQQAAARQMAGETTAQT